MITSTQRPAGSSPAWQRFEQSLALGCERWHDRLGYDLAALSQMNANERDRAQTLLLQRGVVDWRDVEALAMLDTTEARDALADVARGTDYQMVMAVARHAISRAGALRRENALIRRIREANSQEALQAALAEAQDFHPPAVIKALWEAAAYREAAGAMACAALLALLHGLGQTVEDARCRSRWLSFGTEDRVARMAAVKALRDDIRQQDCAAPALSA